MQLINIEKAGLVVDDRVYDKTIYEYRIKKEKRKSGFVEAEYD